MLMGFGGQAGKVHIHKARLGSTIMPTSIVSTTLKIRAPVGATVVAT
jgi:hypothetical protein